MSADAGRAATRRFPKFGEVYEARLDPVIGAEIAKQRPAVIVSNNANNQFARTVTLLPFTSRKRDRVFPYEVAVPRGTAGLRLDSFIKANQIRTVDKSRLGRLLGALPSEYLARVQDAIRIHLNLR